MCPHALLAHLIGKQPCTFFFRDSGRLSLNISLYLTVKIIRLLKSPFRNAKVQIHSLHEKTKTEVNQLVLIREAIWPLAQEEPVRPLETSLHKTQVTEFQRGKKVMDQICIFNIKKMQNPEMAENWYPPNFSFHRHLLPALRIKSP